MNDQSCGKKLELHAYREDSGKLRPRVLLIDDDHDYIEQARASLDGFVDLRVVTDAAHAVTTNIVWRPDLIMLDALFGHGDTFELLETLRRARSSDRFGIVCLARGRGAASHLQPLGNELFGVIRRVKDDHRALRREVERALHLTGCRQPQAA